MSTVVRCGTIFLGKIDIGIIPLMTTKPTEQLYNLERRRLKSLYRITEQYVNASLLNYLYVYNLKANRY